MKIKYMALAIGAIMSSNVIAAKIIPLPILTSALRNWSKD